MSEGKKWVVTIDGPAGAGKSTAATGVASALGYIRLNTGLLYRALGYFALRSSIDLDDETSLVSLLRELALRFGPSGELFRDDQLVEESELRTTEVAAAASRVSVHAGVRNELLDVQRKAGQHGGIVAEGRDMGTKVFPKAEIKVFLTASTEARAERRAEELQGLGRDSDISELKKGIRERDKRDTSRNEAPLRAAEDAHLLDATELDKEAVVREIVALVKRYEAPG